MCMCIEHKTIEMISTGTAYNNILAYGNASKLGKLLLEFRIFEQDIVPLKLHIDKEIETLY